MAASEQSKIAACNVIRFLTKKDFFRHSFITLILNVDLEFLKIAKSKLMVSIEQA